MIRLKDETQINILRAGGKRLAEILRKLADEVKLGVETQELDKLAEKLILANGDKPAFKNYRPDGMPSAYPASLCVSINEEIVHGLPSGRKIKDGDIVTLDLGLEHNGFFTDMAITVPVGKVSQKNLDLIKATDQALEAGIKAIRPGNTLGDIGFAISASAKASGFNIVKELCGHGVGFLPHEDPYVPNFGKRGLGVKLKPGLVLAIEPMLTFGSGDIICDKSGFVFSSRDGQLSSHSEKTVVVTKDGVEILTK
jgi:methionyl aminopeptidase